MLIEDGKRLYMMSEDPDIQQKMRELDAGPTIPVGLAPVASEAVVEHIDANAVRQSIIDKYNPVDMSAIMQEYLGLNAVTNAQERGVKIAAVKQCILRFLDELDATQAQTRKKLFLISKLIGEFAESSLRGILEHRGLTFDEVIKKGADTNLTDSVYNTLKEVLRKRCR